MAEFPALTLWTDAYLSDTRHLSTLEHGAYLLLLMEAWRRPNCDLPDDDKILSRLAGLSLPEWGEVKDAVMAFWKRDGRSKTWTQKRLLNERDKARVRSRSQSDKATKRWKNTKKDDAAAMPVECPEDASTATATAHREEEPIGSPSQGAGEASPDLGEFEPAPVQQFTPEDLGRMWNRAAQEMGLPKVREMTDARRKRALTMIRKYGREGFVEAISAIERSTFLRGQTEQQFKADLDFLLQQKSFTRLIEGFYDRSSRAQSRSRYEPDGAMAYLQRSLGIEGDHGSPGPSGRWDDGVPEGGHRLPYSGD